jgi:hypothetical protein
VLLLFVIVGAVWIWQNPGFVQASLRWVLPGSTSQDNVATEINALAARVARLEQGLPSGLAGVSQRLDALEARLPNAAQAAAPQPPADLRPLLGRLAAIEARMAAMAHNASPDGR